MKKAFTLLELIFVIIVIGIISYVALPNIGAGKLQKAADQVVSHIRYTQHLAMSDDKFDTNDPLWFRENWQIRFIAGPVEVGYEIYTDTNHNGFALTDIDEFAQDPLRNVDISHATGVADLGSEYEITNIVFSANCRNGTSRELSFDFLGRPYFDITATSTIHEFLLRTQCRITLTNPEGDIIIGVEPETGYVRIL